MLRYGAGFWGETLYRVFYGEGIKEPRFDQTYGDNFGDFGNPSLKPEASKTWTSGLEQKLFKDRVRLSAEYFYSRFYNIVSFRVLHAESSEPGYRQHLRRDLFPAPHRVLGITSTLIGRSPGE